MDSILGIFFPISMKKLFIITYGFFSLVNILYNHKIERFDVVISRPLDKYNVDASFDSCDKVVN